MNKPREVLPYQAPVVRTATDPSDRPARDALFIATFLLVADSILYAVYRWLEDREVWAIAPLVFVAVAMNLIMAVVGTIGAISGIRMGHTERRFGIAGGLVLLPLLAFVFFMLAMMLRGR